MKEGNRKVVLSNNTISKYADIFIKSKRDNMNPED